MEPVTCFVCQTQSFFYYSNILNIKSRHTKRPIIEFIKSFIEISSISFNDDLTSATNCICYECFDKINVYDLAKSTVEQIQKEMYHLLGRIKLDASKSMKDGFEENEHDDSSDSDYGFDDDDYFQPIKQPEFKCTICSVDFKTESKLSDHKQLHQNVSPLECVYCHNSFTSKSGLMSHVLAHVKMELGETDFQCEYCGQTFVARRRLTQHVKNVHLNARKFECDICHYKFATKMKIKNHMISHSKIKDYSCSTCGQRFAYKGSVKIHEMAHLGITPKTYKCTICGEAYGRKYKLRAHMLRCPGLPL